MLRYILVNEAYKFKGHNLGKILATRFIDKVNP